MRGRRSLKKRYPELVAKIVADYQYGLKSQHIAPKYGVSTATVMKYVREAGLAVTPKWYHYSVFAKWLRDNPHVELPTNPTAISTLTGISVHAIKGYLKRRRQQAADFEADLPDLTDTPLVLVDTIGRPFRTKTLKSCKVECDYSLLVYRVVGTTHDGETITALVNIEALRNKLLSIGAIT